MKISTRWLARYVDLPADPEFLIQKLTFSGIEVEAVEHLKALPESVLTAKVISAERIPDTDHLMVCSVDFGGVENAQVVCGAPNCRAGMVSVIALPGADLPQITIKSAKLKGVESHGMLCSEKELGISDNHAGIIELDPETPIGISANEIFELPDILLELEITPNRSDLLGYQGIARDLSSSLNIPLHLPEITSFPGTQSDETGLNLVLRDSERCPRYTARLLRNVTVKDSPQWLKTSLVKSGLRPINNIVDITNYVMMETGHPLHAFDYDKLLPLNPQDKHPAIVIRTASQGEEFDALDGKSYTLDPNDLVIADGRNPSALAGVIGGKESSITEATTRIVLESAAFCPTSIRATAYKHKISTDSSYRFERHLSPASPVRVSDRAVELLLGIAGGEVCNEIYDAYPVPRKPQYLGIRPRRYAELVGYELEDAKIRSYLLALGCKFTQYGAWIDGLVDDLAKVYCHHAEEEKAGKTEFTEIDCDHALYFEIPPQRVDLSREADLIEELARLDGYDKIPQKQTVSQIMDRHGHRVRRNIEDLFVTAGFYETLNYSFSDPAQLPKLAFGPEDVERKSLSLINPQSSNQSAMRISLLPGLLENIAYNLNHGERNLKLMESGKVYHRDGGAYCEPLKLTALMTGSYSKMHWKAKAEPAGFYQAKGLVESVLETLGIDDALTQAAANPMMIVADSLEFHSGEKLLATIGRLSSGVAENAGIDLTILKQDLWVIDLEIGNIIEATRGMSTEFKPLPRYPSVTRDVSFLIADNIPFSQIAETIRRVDIQLVRSVEVFDEYRGKQVTEGNRSISLRLTIQDMEKTLTDERVDQLIATVVKTLVDKWNINMR